MSTFIKRKEGRIFSEADKVQPFNGITDVMILKNLHKKMIVLISI